MLLSHADIIVRELAMRGRVTYADLRRRYEPHGYSMGGFASAVYKLRRQGIVAKAWRRGVLTLAADAHCPCCGRML